MDITPVYCPVCENKCSPEIAACIHCGHPMRPGSGPMPLIVPALCCWGAVSVLAGIIAWLTSREYPATGPLLFFVTAIWTIPTLAAYSMAHEHRHAIAVINIFVGLGTLTLAFKGSMEGSAESGSGWQAFVWIGLLAWSFIPVPKVRR